MAKLNLLVVVGLESDGLLQLPQVLLHRPIGEVVGGVGIVESLVLPRLLPQTVVVVEALLPPPRLAVTFPQPLPALLHHLGCLQHAIKQILHSSTYIFCPTPRHLPFPYKPLYILMISSFKGLTPNNVASALSAFAGPKLHPSDAIPKGLNLVSSPEREYLECKFIYSDFKQALRHLLEISRICRSLNYHPEIFNVYNRIELRLCSSVGKEQCVTAKDCYMALFLEELHLKTAAQAHEGALARLQELA